MSKELTQYDFPDDLKKMDLKEMELLSYAIRDFLIEKVSKTGGHLASNLGVVELTIALHKVFNSPDDKMIWDVGHQSYVHKILTGRAGEFDGLRQMNGISGFPKGKESPHDAFDTGHSSNSISAAAGMAAARDLKGERNEVIAIIGDGSLTGGMAYEGLNNVGASKSKMIVILNDNGMSISRNIGGVSQHLSKLRTSNGYLRVKKTIKRALNRIPVIGDDLSTNIGHAKDRIKYALLSGGVIFEELGFTYLGPINGHNIRETIEVLELAKHVNGPVFIHVMTRKGRGYRTAEIDPNKFHGISPFNPETGKVLKPSGMTYSKVLGMTIENLAAENKKITAVSAAMCDATGLGGFAKKYPRQFFDVGIAEAHGVTFAAGLAKSGMRPLVAIYSSFLQRAYDQIIEDVCIQNLPVVFAIDRAGIVGADGETHHGLFDITYLTSMPNMTVLAPSDGNQLAAMVRYAFSLDGPVAIRYPRGDCLYDPEEQITFDGKNQRIFEGKDLDIWAVGKMLQTALETREQLKVQGIDAGIVDVAAIKPLDLSCLKEKSKLVVTIEDGLLAGGFGDKFIAESKVQEVLTFGWPDQFVEHGDCDGLYKKYGLDADSITERICEHIERKA
ncbi:1-deoxy-D-xylulose-5-phosphate synthase [Emergencia timonensis]